MRALAFLLADEIETDRGCDTLRRVADGLALDVIPAVGNLWVYANLILEPDEEGVPVEILLEVTAPNGRTSRVMSGQPIGPMRRHLDMPSVWGLKFHVSVTFEVPGVYSLRLISGNRLLAERPMIVTQGEGG